MELGCWLIDHMVENPWVASGCSKKLRPDGAINKCKTMFVARVIPRKKVNISLTLIHLLLD
jgi:hypothetical protein